MKSKFEIVGLVAGVMLLFSPTWAQAQEPVQVRGTSVSLAPPEGFSSSLDFAGFFNEETGASILVTELPSDPDQSFISHFRDDESARTNTARMGVELEQRREIMTDANIPVILLKGVQSVRGERFQKWIAVLETDRTVMLTLQTPEGTELEDEAVIRTILSVRVGQTPNVQEQISALPFRFEAVSPFRVVGSLMGTSVFMTAGENDTDPDRVQPMVLIVYQVHRPVPSEMLQAVSMAMLQRTRGFEDATVETSERVRFAGQDGVVIRGLAPSSNRRVEQYLSVTDDGRLVTMIGAAPPEKFESVAPMMEAIAASVALKD